MTGRRIPAVVGIVDDAHPDRLVVGFAGGLPSGVAAFIWSNSRGGEDVAARVAFAKDKVTAEDAPAVAARLTSGIEHFFNYGYRASYDAAVAGAKAVIKDPAVLSRFEASLTM